VERELDDLTLGHPDDDAVLHERGVEGREGRAVEAGERAEMRLDPGRLLAQRLGERAHLHLGREAREVGELRLEAAVHEDEAMPLGVHEPGLEVREGERGRRRLDRAEGALGDRRDRSEVPVLVARGGEAERGEALEGLLAQRGEPRRPLAPAVRRGGGELVGVRRDGHGQTPAGSRSQS
jgi:hypothetical protein